MIKTFKYFIQAIIIYLFFIIGKILGIKISRKIFSFLFRKLGPVIRSKKVIKKNLLKFSKDISEQEIETICSNMWANYGMTFIEYIFLKDLRNSNSHIKIIGEEKLDNL